MEKFIINFTPTGMVPTKAMNPHTPVFVDEIIENVLFAAEQGAAMAHIHARDQKTEEPTNSEEIYGRIFSGIRKHNKEIIICASLSGRNVSDPALRAAPLHLTGDAKPDMGSLTTSSLNFIKQASVNSPETVRYLAEKMQEKKVAPELEIFDIGMANALTMLDKAGLLPPKLYGNIMLGNLYGAQYGLSDILAIVHKLPANMTYSFGGLGKFQTRTLATSMANGHGVRVGLEDNIWYDDERTTLATNEMLIKRVLRLAEELELEPASPKDVREQLGLAPGNGQYGLL